MAREQGRESTMVTWRTCSFKYAANEEPQGDFKKDL